jgi:hypothetical protein
MNSTRILIYRQGLSAPELQMITKRNFTKVTCTVLEHNSKRENNTCLLGTKPPVRENDMYCSLSPASIERIKKVHDWTGKVRWDAT